MKFKQVLLNAKECSGRGVRISVLGIDARANVMENAAKEVGAEGTMAQFRLRESTDGVFSMVVQVTEKAGFKKFDELLTATWKKVSFQELAENTATHFNQKDLAALREVFRALHDVTDKEVETILGEAQDVTED